MAETGKSKNRSYDGDYMSDGQRGEQIVIEWLSNRDEIESIIDVRQDQSMQRDDVDLQITTNQKIVLIEIKTDKHLGLSNNILFEKARINHVTTDSANCVTLGWSVRSSADWIIYYGPSVNKLYLIRLHDLQRAFQKYSKDARDKINVKIIPTDEIKSTVNVLIPMSYVERNIQIIDLGVEEQL